ncbi:DUF362 domain-containing protein [Moorena sp. SIO3H5]|uniref:DUF362 domain-containing protein n=1 Tax=Moorena sp. SIO3H5 TaxID=2607834 RepID=UPI0013B959AF|nr:DUF362 domain-containing protein [Moorena sp. SIO3H5]NEO69471.1 DUF362 domain-containing protein [Moorena sp. SIO3H5]
MQTVSLINADSYNRQLLRGSLERLLEPLGGMSAFVKKGNSVLLKPNLLTAGRPGKECITRPEIVYCVAQLVKEAGGKPFFGDSPAFGSARGVAKANGYLPMMAELDIPIVEFHGKGYETASDTFNHLRLSKEAMNADVVINLPKVKSHMQLTLTMGVKNLFGCVPGKMKAWWHMEAGKDETRFGEMLVETARAINPQLTIIDGIIGQEGNGPIGGEPRHLGILGASEDVFALDRSIVEILNVEPALVPTLAAQKRLGLLPDLAEIDFPYHRPLEIQVRDWKLPDTMKPIDFGMPRVIKSTFKHLYIRLIKEPINAYGKS